MITQEIYQVYNKKLDQIIQAGATSENIEELKSILSQSDNNYENSTSTSGFTIASVLFVLSFVAAAGISSTIHSSLAFILIMIFGVIISFIAYLIISAVNDSRYSTLSFVLYLNEILQRGWHYHNESSIQLWNKFSRIYPYLHLGDSDDSIYNYVSGEYKSYTFKYFEYDYSIEEVEYEEYEDEDGNTYEEEYYYDVSYTDTCLVLDIKNVLPSIYISGGYGSSNLKFSYIEFNERVSVYSKDSNRAYAFFDPQTQEGFLQFYKLFPSTLISIYDNKIFIKFPGKILGIARHISFDANLQKYFHSKALAEGIEKLIIQILPITENIKIAKV